MKKIVAVALILLAFAPLALAQTPTAAPNPCTGGDGASLGRCVSQIYIWALGIAGVLALVMIMVGGYMIMTASGNGSQVQKGREYIISSAIGLALLLGAYLLLSTINKDLVNFNEPDFNNAPPAAQEAPRGQ